MDHGRSQPDAAATQSPSADAPAQIRALLDAGKCKQAVELAKEHHKRTATPDSELTLVQAYVARIQQFQTKGAFEDAATLIKLVGERFPRHQSALSIAEIRTAAGRGKIDELVRPLTRPDITPEMREAIEAVIRRDWTDLPALADCTALPADHPLRQSAAAVHRAFVKGTSEPVTDEQIALPEVSRRSPLAGWKMLIRAIAAFYRNDDDGCRRALEGIPADAAVRRLVPALMSMMDPTSGVALPGKSAHLRERVVPDEKSLRKAIAQLDTAFDSRYLDDLYPAIRSALTQCIVYAPQLQDTFRQHITVRCYVTDVPPKDVSRFVGTVLHDAYFWRLAALGYEKQGQWSTAAIHWERFFKHAVHEKLFAADSVEAAAVYFHMAALAAQYSAEDLEDLRMPLGRKQMMPTAYKDQPPEIRQLMPRSDSEVLNVAFDPDLLFRKSAELQGDPETFTAWLAWGRKADYSNDQLQDLALLWRQKLANDPQAPLLLSNLAEDRKALKLSLKYLSEAEQIDPMNPAVRKARLRLTLGTAWNHLTDEKAKLLEADLAQLQSLPAMRDGDRGLLLDGLRVALHAISNDATAAQAGADRLVERAGPLLADILMKSIRSIAFLERPPTWPTLPAAAELNPDDIVDAFTRACTLSLDLNLSIMYPQAWNPHVLQVLRKRPTRLSASQLIVLAKSAISRGNSEQAYLATSAGLPSAIGATAGRFLLLRAKSLVQVAPLRVSQCLRAAMELARQANDVDLIAEISEAINAHPQTRDSLEDSPRLGDELLAKVMEKERAAVAFPLDYLDAAEHVVRIESAHPRRSRRNHPFFGPDFDEDENGFDFDDEDDDEPAMAMPTESQIQDELLASFGGKPPSLQELQNLDPSKIADLIRKLTGMSVPPGVVDQFKAMGDTFFGETGGRRKKHR